MSVEWIRTMVRAMGARRGTAEAPALPLLRHETSPDPAAWLRESLTTFAASVASFVPDRFAAYARIHHPFTYGGGPPVVPGAWLELASRYGVALRDPAAAEAFAYNGVPGAQARTGTLPPPLIDALLDHLGPATRTPELCYFAVWEGFGGSIVPADLSPKLALPNRRYHVFAGPLAAARTSYSAIPVDHQSANLWWPADQAWCVATEVDHAWSYVAGPRRCVETLVADIRLDAIATGASDLW
jgi:hypothetical protein